MERQIGEVFQCKGDWYQCVVALQGCRECSFRTQDYCTRHSECMSTERSDKTSVIIKKLEKIGESFYSKYLGKSYQRYKTYIPAVGNNFKIRVEPVEHVSRTEIYVEIKQNKEEMEEKNNGNTPLNVLTDKYVNGDICYDDFEKEVKALYSCKEEIKPTLKPFDLEEAKLGEPVCTRDGRKVRIICFDKVDKRPIVALISDNGGEFVYEYLADGKSYNGKDDSYDLMMLPEKKEGWAKVRKDINLYDTKEEADRKMIGNDEYVTAKVEWEE